MKGRMKVAHLAAMLGVLFAGCLAAAATASADDGDARGQFEEIVAAINEKNYEPIRNAIDRADMLNRIFSVRPVAVELQQTFRDGFWDDMESMVMDGLPDSRGEIVGFSFNAGRGSAVVRYTLPRYFYVYQIWTLRHDSRGRLRLVDWRDPGQVESFVEKINSGLVISMPTRPIARQVLNMQSASDSAVFQAAELLKSLRDASSDRFFEIYAEQDVALRKQFMIAAGAIRYAFAEQDPDRLLPALELFISAYGDDPDYAMAISNTFFAMDNYTRAYDYLVKYHKVFVAREGSMPSRLSALALAAGNAEEADRYAVIATENEPEFELGWWSLLRARAKTGNHEGALEALEALEDRFDKRMDEATLRRDRFGAFIELVESDEFQKWRSARG